MWYVFDKIENFRSIDNLYTIENKKIKINTIFRSGELFNLTKEDINKIKKLKINSIIDFRDKDEINKHSDTIIENINYFSFSALPPFVDKNTSIYEQFKINPKKVFNDIYYNLAKSEISYLAYKKFFRVLLENKGKPFLYHCTQGKDRTGIATFLLLTVLGVNEKDILNEYFLTNDYMKKKVELLAQNKASDKEIEVARIYYLVSEENIMIYKNSIVEKFGSIDNFIHNGIGLTNDEIRQLKEYYIEKE